VCEDGWTLEGGKEHLYCMIGYRHPTKEEAEKFLENKINEWGYDTVASVREISKEEALENFNMDGWQHMKVFGGEIKKGSLEERIQAAGKEKEKILKKEKQSDKELCR